MHFTCLSEINDSINQISIRLGQVAGNSDSIESIQGHLSSIKSRINANTNVNKEFGCGNLFPRIPELTQK